MPQGKSGKYYSNPAVMRSRDDAPDASPLNATIAPPDADTTDDQDQPVAELVICKYSDGSFSVRHESPDGAVTDEQKQASTEDIQDQVSQFISDASLSPTDNEAETDQK
jgi:hypothetical protein